MPTLQLATDSLPTTRLRTVLVWLTIFVLTVAYYLIEHTNTQISSLNAFQVTGEQLSERFAEGDAGRRFAIPMIAAYGVFLMLLPGGYRLKLDSRLGWLLLGYLTWCGLSIVWSVEPSLTLRHFTVLLFCSIAALGIAKQLTLHDLCVVTLAVTAILIFNGVRTELALGTFHPLSPEYRFAGTVHPNVQSPYCATMAIAAGFLASRAQRGKLLLWGLCLAALVLLWLTKSRTVCAALLVAVLAYRAINVSWTKRILIVSTIVFAASAITFTGMLFGFNLIDRAANVILIGREDEAESLSGRVPLWEALLPHAEERLLFGHGYLTFWSPKRIDNFTQTFQWTVPDGHCAYLDTILDLGIVGAGLCLVVLTSAIGEVGHRYRFAGELGYGFLLVLLVCRSLNGVLESAFTSPNNFCAFVMVCGLAHLGYCHQAVPVESASGAAVPALPVELVQELRV
ncbi:MAG TPA: O-antigen ligase family protein [Pirellulales bacterium]|jgi:O-antigen ligase|nr:O-antigen ligase family protein [Pirellulales bacterium]